MATRQISSNWHTFIYHLQQVRVEVRFAPVLDETEVRNEAVRMATRQMEAAADKEYKEALRRQKEQEETQVGARVIMVPSGTTVKSFLFCGHQISLIDDNGHVRGPWLCGFQIIFNITKVNKYFVGIFNKWIALPMKKKLEMKILVWI